MDAQFLPPWRKPSDYNFGKIGLQGKQVTVELGKRGMFDRFTDLARRAVVLAQEHARVRGDHLIGTEHLILGLLDGGPSVATEVLTESGVSASAYADLANHSIDSETEAPPQHIPFSASTKKALELALREALMLGHRFVGTEHLLLALLRQGASRGVAVLTELGADPVKVRVAVLENLRASQVVQPGA